MVLKKVGEFLTTINVNGKEKVSELQSGDRTFNISEVFNTTVSVNGSQEESFNQQSDSNYNVDASVSSTVNWSHEIDAHGSSSGGFGGTSGPFDWPYSTDTYCTYFVEGDTSASNITATTFIQISTDDGSTWETLHSASGDLQSNWPNNETTSVISGNVTDIKVVGGDELYNWWGDIWVADNIDVMKDSKFNSTVTRITDVNVGSVTKS